MAKPITIYNKNLFFGLMLSNLDWTDRNIVSLEINLLFNDNLKIVINDDNSHLTLDFSQTQYGYIKNYYIVNFPLTENNNNIKIQNYEEEEWVDYSYNYQNLLNFFPYKYASYKYNLQIVALDNKGREYIVNNKYYSYYDLQGYYGLNEERGSISDYNWSDKFGRFSLYTFSINSDIYSTVGKLVYFDSKYNDYTLDNFTFNYYSDNQYDNNATSANNKGIFCFYKVISKGSENENLYYANGQFYSGFNSEYVFGAISRPLPDRLQASGQLKTAVYIYDNNNISYTASAQYEQAIDSASVQDFNFYEKEDTNALSSSVRLGALNNFPNPQKIIFCVRIYNDSIEHVSEKITNNDFSNMPEILEEFVTSEFDIVFQGIEIQKANAIRYKEQINDNQEIIDVYSSDNTDNIRLDITIKNNLNSLIHADTMNLYLYNGRKISLDEYNDFWSWYLQEDRDFYLKWKTEENLINSSITSSETTTMTWHDYSYDFEGSGGTSTLPDKEVNVTLNSHRRIYHYTLSELDIKYLLNTGVFSGTGGMYDFASEYEKIIKSGSYLRLNFNLPEFDYIEIINEYTEEAWPLETYGEFEVIEPNPWDQTYIISIYKDGNDITEDIKEQIYIEYSEIKILPEAFYSISQEIDNGVLSLSKIKTGSKIDIIYSDGTVLIGDSQVQHLLSNQEDGWLLIIEDTCMSALLEKVDISYYNMPITQFIFPLFNITNDSSYFNIENNGVSIGEPVNKVNVFDKTFTIGHEYTTIFKGKTNIFPVGSIYLTLSPTNPSQYFVGTWLPFAKGRTLVGVDSDSFIPNPAWEEWIADPNPEDPREPPRSLPGLYNGSGKIGGEETHTLTIDEMPAHAHGRRTSAGGRGSADNDSSGSRGYKWHDSGNSQTESTGGGQPHNNMPPYITCYMWLRIA